MTEPKPPLSLLRFEVRIKSGTSRQEWQPHPKEDPIEFLECELVLQNPSATWIGMAPAHLIVDPGCDCYFSIQQDAIETMPIVHASAFYAGRCASDKELCIPAIRMPDTGEGPVPTVFVQSELWSADEGPIPRRLSGIFIGILLARAAPPFFSCPLR